MGLFRMPSLGSDMKDGTLVEWLVKPGDAVSRGDVVAVVETQKGAIEIEVFEAGRVTKLLASTGDRLPVGAPLAEIDGPAEAPPPAPESTARPEAPAPAPPPEVVASPGRPPAPGDVVPASPAARRAAEAAGLPLSGIPGSGPEGAVLLADVEAAAAGAQRPAVQRGFRGDEMRAAIAAAMTRANREIPHFYLAHQIDLQAAADWLAELNAARPPEARLARGLLLIRAVAKAVRKVAGLNGTWDEGGFELSDAVHVGVAVHLRGGGLVAPALRDADAGDIDALMSAMRDLVERARAGRLRGSEITSPTITVSSLGDRGVDAMLGVVFPPQAALVCFGEPARRPVVVGDAVVPRLVVEATLSADHRVADGRLGARFLRAVDEALQSPETL